jgi:3-deoxy-7-phosphoheptulonate synthase
MWKFFFCLLLLQDAIFAWTPGSWRDFKKYDKQMPKYKSRKALKTVEENLKKQAPLVSADECHALKKEIHLAGTGRAFLFMGGDCAESFDDFSSNHVRDFYKFMLQIGILLSYSTGLPTIKMARIAGQYAKPRSNPYEILKNGTKVLSYKGDIINDFHVDKRNPDPKRMLQAYHQSTQTLNLLRAFSYGGYSDIRRLDHWRTQDGYVCENSYYESINLAIRFIKALKISKKNPVLTQTDIYTAHECLLLPYEEALTRCDSFSKKMYDCSSHFLWVGERTRSIKSPHVEFLSGVHNPIGIKISEACTNEELIALIHKLNPENEYGKITLITRFGVDKIQDHLPRMIRAVQENRKYVTWCCDPMHGNTKSMGDFKTRIVSDVLEEIMEFFEIHKEHGTIPGGIHLEMTPNIVTECIDFRQVTSENLSENYLSKCDPRLNGRQVLDVMEDFADFYFHEFM